MIAAPPSTPATASPGLVAVVTYNGLCTFEFGIAVEIFGLSRPEFAFPWYEFAVVAAEGRRVSAIGGISIEAEAGLERLSRARTIIVPGWRDREEHPPQSMLDAIVAASERGARVLSICSGVFVLAAAGLLDGKRATTHWRHMPALRASYPAIRIEHDVLYVDEGNVITSSGSAAGIDACLHLVRRDFGSKVAGMVARRLVMPPHREGGQAQYVTAPVQERPGRPLAEVMDWARERLGGPVSLAEMAGRAAMSERSFLRHFRNATGLTPMNWLQQERMVRARDLLEGSDAVLPDVAAACGFASPETFRTAFRKSVGIAPGAYRARFRRRPLPSSPLAGT